MSLNKVMLIGNAGKDPEVRYLENNGKVATLRLATSEKYRDRDGNVKESVEWHTVVTWRAMADLVEKYVRKGSLLYVEGRLRSRTWNDRSGNPRYSTEVYADNLQLLGRNPDQQSQAERKPDGPVQQEKPSGNIEADDDLPF